MAFFPGRPAFSFRKRLAAVVTPPITTPGTGGWFFPLGAGNYGTGAMTLDFSGQSNCQLFCDTYDAPGKYNSVWRMMDNFRDLTGISQPNSVEYFSTSNPASIHSGTHLYHFNTVSDPKWMEPVGNTLTDPATWGNTDLMTQFLTFCGSKQNLVAQGRPTGLVMVWSEYPSKLNGTEVAVYELALLEYIKRWRATKGTRSKTLTPVFLIGPAYDSGTNDNALKTIRNAWRNIASNAANCVFIINGSSLDADDRDDASHWDYPSSDRVANRSAIGLAHWAYDNGLVAAGRDLSYLPRLGPTIVSLARVSGQTNKLRAGIFYDDTLSDDMVAPTGTPDYGSFDVRDNGTRVNVTNITRVDGSTLEFTMASAISGNGVVTLDYGYRTPFEGPGAQWTSNWHLKTKPANYVAVPDLAGVKMILNRYGGVVTLGTSNAPSGGGGSSGTNNPNPVADPTTQTFSISPNDPGTRDAGPQTLTITSTNLTSISWTRVGLPPDYPFLGGATDDGQFTTVPTTGSVAISPNWTQTGQIVKYWPTGNIQAYKDTLPVTVNAAASVPAAPGTDRAFAHDFTKDLALGINLERDNTAMVTNAWLDDLIAAGCTHVRLFPYSNATLGFKNSAQMGNHYDAVNRILAKGLKAILDLQDVSSIGDLNNSGTQPYITQCCTDITARGWNPAKVAIGHTNEMANAGNSTFNAINATLLTLMRSKLPAATILVHGAGNWSSPDTLTDGTLQVATDKRRLYQWHHYEFDHSNQAAWKTKGDAVKAWAATNGVETINGEFAKFDQNFNDQAYSTYPAVIDAFAKGAGSTGGTIWTVTNGTGWRLNVSGSDGTLRAEVKTALTAANTFIKAQSYFNT